MPMVKFNKNIGLTVLILGLLVAVGFISYDFGKESSQPKKFGQEEVTNLETPTGGEEVKKKEYIEIGDKRIKIDDQPDEITFGQYFSEFYLTRTEPYPRFEEGEKLEPTNIFKPDDWFCLYGTSTKEVGFFIIVLNAETKENIPGHDIRYPPKLGKFAVGGSLDLPIGSYELRVYVEDILVKVFPLEVKQELP